MAEPHFLAEALRQSNRAGLTLSVRSADKPLATAVELAVDSASRNRGLLGREAMPEGAALIIAPSSAVHTFGMRFPIDIVFVARDGRVLKIRHAVQARRIAVSLRAFAVVELAAGAAARAAVTAGDQLVVRAV